MVCGMDDMDGALCFLAAFVSESTRWLPVPPTAANPGDRIRDIFSPPSSGPYSAFVMDPDIDNTSITYGIF